MSLLLGFSLILLFVMLSAFIFFQIKWEWEMQQILKNQQKEIHRLELKALKRKLKMTA